MPYEAGKGSVVFTVADVEATVIICHDTHYPELACLGMATGAQIIFIATNKGNITKEYKILGLRSMQISRATENHVLSVLANAPVDPEHIIRINCSHGNSKIVDTNGSIIVEAGSFKEGIFTGVLDLEQCNDMDTLLDDSELKAYESPRRELNQDTNRRRFAHASPFILMKVEQELQFKNL